jgi:response regulator RpfG family c-di-GMP phosphodiesterase
MISDRPYREAMEDEGARAILQDGAGTQWDPTVVEKFLSIRWNFDAERRIILPAA